MFRIRLLVVGSRLGTMLGLRFGPLRLLLPPGHRFRRRAVFRAGLVVWTRWILTRSAGWTGRLVTRCVVGGCTLRRRAVFRAGFVVRTWWILTRSAGRARRLVTRCMVGWCPLGRRWLTIVAGSGMVVRSWLGGVGRRVVGCARLSGYYAGTAQLSWLPGRCDRRFTVIDRRE
jgi:hypothetical protein